MQLNTGQSWKKRLKTRQSPDWKLKVYRLGKNGAISNLRMGTDWSLFMCSNDWKIPQRTCKALQWNMVLQNFNSGRQNTNTMCLWLFPNRFRKPCIIFFHFIIMQSFLLVKRTKSQKDIITLIGKYEKFKENQYFCGALEMWIC